VRSARARVSWSTASQGGASASGKAQVADDKSVKAQKVSDVGDRGFRHGVVERRGHRYAHVWRHRREPA
jgi:hypothetical protein